MSHTDPNQPYIPLRIRHVLEVSRAPLLAGVADQCTQLMRAWRRPRSLPPVLESDALSEPVRLAAAAAEERDERVAAI